MNSHLQLTNLFHAHSLVNWQQRQLKLKARLFLVLMLGLLFTVDGWAESDSDPNKPILMVGISAQSFPDVSVSDIEVTIKLLVAELSKSSGYEAMVTAYTNEKLLQQDFEQGKINFVVTSSLILALEYDQALLADGFRFVRESKFPDQLLIIGQQRYELDAFRGKRMLLAKNDPMNELNMDYFAWKTFKQGYKTSFKVLPAAGKVNQLLLKIFFDEADLTSVYQNFYETALDLNPQLRNRLKILAQLDNVPAAGAFFRKDTPEVFKETVILKALHMADKPRGKQLMEMFKCDRIIRSNIEDLIPAKQLFNARQRLVTGQ
ncbi:hypothetical protein A1359_05610 [Methylomonas lenta]|uniref:Solute-binding protein family 3/N-terminal domain-containing protein n=2 Tax=Methylomonas lenta TaxID=980561 RepID=A0A177NLE6_9GAMM|nr:hypothetical protein A1359_05610 [Methylomonas lenta]